MLLIALVVFLICAVRGWWPAEGEEAALAGSRSAAPVAGATSEAARATPDVRSRFVSSSPDRTRAAEDSAPPARFAFDALTEGREPLKTEARMFQAQKWEPVIA